MYKKTILVGCLVIVIFLTNMYSPSSKHVLLEKTLTAAADTLVCHQTDGKTLEYEFENTGDSPLKFWFKQTAGVNYFDEETILSSVIQDRMTDEQKAFALWRFISNAAFHYDFPYNHHLPDNTGPLALATFPYLMCGEKAFILANFAHLTCLPSRVINRDGHVVPEIFYDNGWHMFDADENVVFFNSVGKVADIATLS